MANIDILQLLDVVGNIAADMREEANEKGNLDLLVDAKQLDARAYFYQMGMNKTIPPELEQYIDHLDPEYGEYLRLKAKFEND